MESNQAKELIRFHSANRHVYSHKKQPKHKFSRLLSYDRPFYDRFIFRYRSSVHAAVYRFIAFVLVVNRHVPQQHGTSTAVILYLLQANRR